MKINHSLKRKLFQLIAFGYSNAHILNFKYGKIYEGKWKQFCNPGLNNYMGMGKPAFCQFICPAVFSSIAFFAARSVRSALFTDF